MRAEAWAGDTRFKADKVLLEADGPDDREFLTCIFAAIRHGRVIYVCKTDDPKDKCYEYTPAKPQEKHGNE